MGREATAEQIKAAYRRLALKWHPDRNPDNKAQAEAEFKKISKAYAVLTDPQQKAMFDLGGGSFHGQVGGNANVRPMTQEEAARLFRQMFGNKPLHEIIREVESVAEQQNHEMAAREEELRIRSEKLKAEVAALQLKSMQTSDPARKASFLAQAQRKEAEMSQVQQAVYQSWLHRFQQNVQARTALSKLRMLDPRFQAERQAENSLRRGLAWGAALGAYFVVGTSFLGALCVFLGTSLGARLAFTVLSRGRR